MKLYLRIFICRYLTVISLFAIAALAGQYDGELVRFDLEVEVNSLKAVDEAIDPKQIAAKLKLTLPIYPETLSSAQVEARIEHELKTVVEKNFPSARYNEIKKEAEDMFKMYKVGDSVVILRQYAGLKLEVKGRLDAKTSNIIKISSLPIPRVDIDQKDLARLYWSDHELAVKKYVKIETRKFDDKKDEFIIIQRRKIEQRTWTNSGYRRIKRNRQWLPAIDIFYGYYDRQREKELTDLREKTREQVYSEYGYVYQEESQEWIPKTVLEAQAKAVAAESAAKEMGSLLGKVKTFFKEKKQVSIVSDKQEPSAGTSETQGDEETQVETGGVTESKMSQHPVSSLSETDKEEDLWEEEQKPVAVDFSSAKPPEEKDVSDLYDEDD